MKSVITYTVVGDTQRELYKQAEQTYRDLVEDPDAALPTNAILQISPMDSLEGGDGSSQILGWEAEVHITRTIG